MLFGVYLAAGAYLYQLALKKPATPNSVKGAIKELSNQRKASSPPFTGLHTQSPLGGV